MRKLLSDRIAERQLELQGVASSRRQTEDGLVGKKQAAAELRGRIEKLRAECSGLRAKQESIDNILAHHNYTTESTRKLLAALETGRAGEFRPEGVLADFIDVDPAWERAAEEFLHEELEYVVVRDWSEAERSMNLLRTELEGRATFLVEGGADVGQAVRACPFRPSVAAPHSAYQFHQRPVRSDWQFVAPAYGLISGRRFRAGARDGHALSRPAISCSPTVSATTAACSRAGANKPADRLC